ncbi:MAG: competence/damage-inducible protein A [Clostridia bacterium]
MTCEIVCVGTELLLGNTLNTNTHYLAGNLSEIGVEVIYQTVVGDNPIRLTSVLETAFSRAEIVITTGGLGPTCDDLTKEIACKLLNFQMILDENSLKAIKAFYKKIDKEMTDSNIKQAYLPKGCSIFKNDVGTAPGFGITENNKTLIMLPGPPFEMKYMFENYAIQFLNKLTNYSLFSDYIKIFGIGESKVDVVLSDLMKLSNPTVAPYAKEGEVMLRVTAKALDKESADKLKEPILKEINTILGQYIYGINIDSMEEQVVNLLKKQNKKLSIAESCTGGLLSKKITSISGSSDVFECGICSYSNRIKNEILGIDKDILEKYGAVSEQVAKEMATQICKISKSDIGIGITGIAGPTGGTDIKPVGLVYVGIYTKAKGASVRKLYLSRGYAKERDYIRELSSLNAMDMIIKELI